MKMNVKMIVLMSAALAIVAAIVLVPRFIKNNQAPAMTAEEREHQARCLEVMRRDSSVDERMNAVRGIKDQTILAKIARNEKEDNLVRGTAVQHLTSQAALAEIVKKDKGNSMHYYAIEKLTDKALLRDIARNCNKPIARVMAAEKLNDQAILLDIAKNSSVFALVAIAVHGNPTSTAVSVVGWVHTFWREI